MIITLTTFVAAALYLIAGGLLIHRLFLNRTAAVNKREIVALSAVAVVLHCIILYAGLAPHSQWSLGITNAFSIITCAIALVFTFITTRQPIENLGVVVLPIAAAAVIAAWLWPSNGEGLVTPSTQLTVHLMVSILAYAFLSLAVVQAVLLSVQEKRLRQRDPGRLLNALPPIETMESLLFLLAGIGFVLLTLTLISGAIYTRSLFGVTFAFNHHTILAIMAWLIFGVLLAGHIWLGWRGRRATYWTISGFVVLVLGYFGTKYVIEILLA